MKIKIPGAHQRGSILLRTVLTLFILSALLMRASAQKALVVSVFSKYGLDESILDPANLRLPTDYAFELKESTIIAGKTKVLIAKFNPAASGREQWNVVSVDGKTPTLYEINTFRNTRSKPPVDIPDEASYKIESETADQLAISYKLNNTIIPKDATFLKDCKAILTIDLKKKQLSQLELLNEKPVKIGPLTANRFNIVTRYTYEPSTKRYLPISDNLDMEAKFIGKTVSTQVETVYSNYKKATK